MTGSAHGGAETGRDVTDPTRRLYDEVWNAGRYEIASELFHPDFEYATEQVGAATRVFAFGDESRTSGASQRQTPRSG